MSDLSEGVLDVITALAAADIPAALDPRDLELPGVLAVPVTFLYNTLDGSDFETVIDLYLLAPDLPGPQALALLSDLTERVGGVFPIGQLRTVSLGLAKFEGRPLPALVTTVTVRTTP